MIRQEVSFLQACSLIQKGEVVALPTETVYGLAGDIQSPLALRKIFEIKKRPFFDPLIVHFGEKKQIHKLCEFESPLEEKIILSLSDSFHPGPLTFVLKKKSSLSPLITAGNPTVAIRIPNHPLTLNLLKQTKTCLAAPSANLFSKVSPTRAEHIDLNVPILNGGPCSFGIESTIIRVQPSQKTIFILRSGSCLKKHLEHFLKSHSLKDWKVQIHTQSKIPGQFKNHYQPKNPFVFIRVQKKEPSRIEIKTLLQKKYPHLTPVEIPLQPNALLFGRQMYHLLRQIPQGQVGFIVKNPSLNQDEWNPIWERLKKASFQKIYS